jgi:hypothetical protein
VGHPPAVFLPGASAPATIIKDPFSMENPLANPTDLLQAFQQMFSVAANVWFVVLPPLLFFLFKILWMDHVIGGFVSSIPTVLLEIIPPREVEKSPRLMESVFDGLMGTEKGFNPFEKYVQGAVPSTFSFEIANDEAGVHFYVRTPVTFRNLVEAHFYAQYPDVEIVEAEDYVGRVPKGVPNKEWDLWGVDFKLTNADPYPIKTYQYFQEDVTGKMIDPLAGLIETMGKLPPGQRIWLQYIVSPERPDWFKTGKALVEEIVKGPKAKEAGPGARLLFHTGDVFKNVFSGMFGKAEFSSMKEEKKDLLPVEQRLTPVQKKILEALEMNVGRNVFKVKMRLVYVGRREGFDKSFVSAFIGGIKQFNDANLNGFAPEDGSKTYANYLFTQSRLRYRQRRIFRRYRDRSRDDFNVTFVLSTSELATVFHVPDQSVLAPALSRVTAKRAGAPGNLPVDL